MSEFNQDLLTIVVATYNSEATIHMCLTSIKSQDCSDFQLLVVDGASTDRTLETIKKYEDIIDVLISEPDKGVYDAWNKVVPYVKGEWTIFLGSDDAFADSSCVRKILDEARSKSEQFDFMYLKLAVVETLQDTSKVIELMGEGEPEEYESFLTKEMLFPHTGMLHKSSLFSEIGGFSTQFKIASDYEFVLRAHVKGVGRLGKIDKLLVHMSAGGLSTAIDTRILVCKECVEIRKLHGVGSFSLFLRVRMAKIYLGVLVRNVLGDKALLVLVNFYRRMKGKQARGEYK